MLTRSADRSLGAKTLGVSYVEPIVDDLNARLTRGDTFFSFWLPTRWRLVGQREDASPKLKSFMRSFGLVDYWKKHGWPTAAALWLRTISNEAECRFPAISSPMRE